MKTFLIICRVTSSPQVVATLDGFPGIVAWLQIWPGAIVVKTTAELTCRFIGDHLHLRLPAEHTMVTEFVAGSTSWGWMDEKVWQFIQKP